MVRNLGVLRLRVNKGMLNAKRAPMSYVNIRPFYFRPRGYFFFSCSPHLSMKISLLINMKMPKIVGIFIFISRENFMLSYV